jgi:methionyl-tRNA formyltransferase/SAM-dependent methyltransferase
MRIAADVKPALLKRAITSLRRLLFREFDPVTYWETRATTFKKTAVLNIKNQTKNLDEITEQHWTLYDAVLKPNFDAKVCRALDFGCGAGRLTSKLKVYAKSVIGVDISATLLSMTTPLDDIEFRLIEPNHLPFPDGHFDIVFVHLVLGGIPAASDLARTAEEIQRVLTLNGYLFLVENTSSAKDAPYWHYRSELDYVQLFPDIELQITNRYLDAGESISIMEGRKTVRSNKREVVFFCGEESRYGLAHLNPLLREFHLRAVVVPDTDRWTYFLNRTSGGTAVPLKTHQTFMGIIGVIRTTFARKRKHGGLRRLLASKNIELIEAHDVNGDAFIRDLQARFSNCLFFCAAYPQIFSSRLLSVSQSPPVNFHPSLLPTFRGSHPHFWMIAKGAQEGGLTAHYMTKELDGGDILAQVSFPIGQYSYSQLYDKIVQDSDAFVRLVRVFLDSDSGAPMKQDPTLASTFRNDREIHHRIFWKLMTAKQIFDLVRTEQAYCFFRDRRVFIRHAHVASDSYNVTNDLRVEAGTIVEITGGLVVVASIDRKFLELADIRADHSRRSRTNWFNRISPLLGEQFS